MKLVSKKETAVSPVIGTILLVAITVVLVAIIAAVVMPMVSGVGQTHTTGVQVTTDKDGNVFATIVSGEKPVKLEFGGVLDVISNTPVNCTSIGQVFNGTLNASGTGSVTAIYADGSQQVIWSGTLTKA